MSSDFPTLSEVGEENARAYLRRKGEQTMVEWEEQPAKEKEATG
jgi:hypothetical protein